MKLLKKKGIRIVLLGLILLGGTGLTLLTLGEIALAGPQIPPSADVPQTESPSLFSPALTSEFGCRYLYTIDPSTSPTQMGRIFRDAIPSECSGKLYPGIFNPGLTYYYEDFGPFTNTTGTDTCYTVAFDPNVAGGCGTNAHALAYLNSYDPSNQSQNYLGDVGASITDDFSFTVPNGESYKIVVETTSPIDASCNFAFNIQNVPCADKPNIIVEPQSLTFSLLHDNTVQASLTISNTGLPDLNWQIDLAQPASWVDVTPASGTTAYSNTATVQVDFDATGLSAGVYTDSLSITHNDTGQPTILVPLTLNVDTVDLGLVKAANPNPAFAGEMLTYTYAVDNSGLIAASNVTLTDTLPASASNMMAYTNQGDCDLNGNLLDCSLGSLAPEESAQVTVTVVTSSTFVGVLSNTAVVSSPELDSNPANNSASLDVFVQATADLSLSQSDQPDWVLTGDYLTYTVQVQNHGPFEAHNVFLIDQLSPETAYSSYQISQGSCFDNSGQILCNFGTLAVDASAQVTVTVAVTTNLSTVIENQADISSNEGDPRLADNHSVEQTFVNPADLALSMTDSPDPAFAGEPLTYTLTITNLGALDSSGLVLTDTLPLGVNFLHADSSQGSCNFTAGEVVCDLGNLNFSDNAQVTIVAQVQPGRIGVLNNQAVVIGEQVDQNLDNNLASEQTSIWHHLFLPLIVQDLQN